MIVERPLRLDYDYTAGLAQSRFLKGLAQGKIIGEKCPVCGKVYVGSAARARPTASQPRARSKCRPRAR